MIDDLPTEFKDQILDLLPENTELLAAETDHARGHFITVANNKQETVIRVSHIELVDRLHSCDKVVYPNTNSEDLLAIYEEIINEVNCPNCINPAFGVVLERDYDQEHVAGYPEKPCSGELLNIVTYVTEVDKRYATEVIVTKGVTERVVHPRCGCCALKTRLKLAGTVFGVADVDQVIVDGKLSSEVADKIKHCLDAEVLNKHTKATCFTCAEVLGIKEDAISEYFELDVPKVGIVRLRVMEEITETKH